MIREKLIDKRIGDNKQFRWRSHEVSRTEGLSDAVFGFAITLLVVSLEVPKTYSELMQTMRGFGAFAISFALLFIVWYNQYKFFRRYGLQDNVTMLLNGVLLFVAGIVLQGLSYAIVWIVRRPWFTPMFGSSNFVDVALTLVVILLAVASVWFCLAAIRTLGTQWSLAARVVEGHKLVTQGPYSVVRNPIYTGMFGMLLATGLAVSHWIGLLIAIMVFTIGTLIRVRSEEKLLREMFGTEFDAYARDVAAVIPYLI